MKSKALRVLQVAVVVAVMLGMSLVAIGRPAPALAEGEPEPGTVVGIATYTFYPATRIITGAGLLGTVYSASPRTIFGQDVSRVRNWHSADVFVTANVLAGSVVTVTPQYAASVGDWANAKFSYALSDSLATANYRVILSASGSDYLRIPLAGEYLRFMIQYSGTVTPTIDVTLRND